MGRRIAAAALLAGLAAAVSAAVALAGPPEHFAYTSDYSGSASCGTFNDVYQGHLEISGITKFDRGGNPVQDVAQVTGWERNWRSDDPSVSFTAKRTFTVIYDYATNAETDLGMVESATAPGVGVLLHDVGLIKAGAGGVIAVHGPHDFAEQGDAAFCAALLAIS
jgi:hypothetical protein